jgi:ribosomal protein S18 acetylase RimI-like enzyme
MPDLDFSTGRLAAIDSSRWRPADPGDSHVIVEMSLALYSEDPGLGTVSAAQVAETLAVFQREPWRGLAVVLEVSGVIQGYALLVPFYSNEVGGAVCEVDELFVAPPSRGLGLASALFSAIDEGRFGPFAAIALGVTPANNRAKRLYERLGFRVAGTTLLRRSRQT